jgi:hypothetical protein
MNRHRPEDLPRIQRADGGGVGRQQLLPQQACPQVTFGCCTSQQHWHAEMKWNEMKWNAPMISIRIRNKLWGDANMLTADEHDWWPNSIFGGMSKSYEYQEMNQSIYSEKNILQDSRSEAVAVVMKSASSMSHGTRARAVFFVRLMCWIFRFFFSCEQLRW